MEQRTGNEERGIFMTRIFKCGKIKSKITKRLENFQQYWATEKIPHI